MRGGGLLSAGRPLLAAARRVGVAPRPGNGKCLFLFCPSRAVLVSAGLGKASSSGRRAPVAWGWGEGPGKVFSRLLTWPLCPRRHSLRLSFVRLDKGSPSMVCPSPGLESFPESTLRPRPPGKLEGFARVSPRGGGWTETSSVWGLNLSRARALLGGHGAGAGAGACGTRAPLHCRDPASSTGMSGSLSRQL
jgi:hypothetical protein